MKTNEFLRLDRLKLLLIREFYSMKKGLLITLGATVGVMFLISIFISGLTPNINFQSFYYAGLYISGIVVAGTAFRDLRKKETSMMYLTLPASTFEKLKSQVLIVSVGFLIFYVVAFYLFWILIALWRSILDFETPFFNIFSDPDFFISILKLWFWQSIFIIGSIAFTRNPLLKTMALVFSILIILGLFTLFLITKISFDHIHSATPHLMFHSNKDIFSSWLFYILIPVFWIIAYFKLKEKEV
jgi:hypothetical protein